MLTFGQLIDGLLQQRPCDRWDLAKVKCVCVCVCARVACDVCMYPSICSDFSSVFDVYRCALVIYVLLCAGLCASRRMCSYVRVCAHRGVCTGTRAAPASCWQAALAFLLSQAYHCVTTL